MKVRSRLAVMMEMIEAADERKIRSQYKNAEAVSRLEKLEVDYMNERRRTQLLRMDVDEAKQRLVIPEERLEKAKKICEEDEKAWESLQVR